MYDAADPISWPHKVSEIASPFVDSARWNDFEFRDDDIVVASYPKSGGALAQQILGQLVFAGSPNVFGPALSLSPWIEFRGTPDALAVARGQKHRRFLRTHLPVRHLTFSPRARYVAVVRDPRDVAEAGSPPCWSHVGDWWGIRALPNVSLLRYADVIEDLPGQIRKIAAFLDIPILEAAFPDMVEHCSFAHMRKLAAADPLLRKAFLEDLADEDAAGRGPDREALELAPDCAAWLRGGFEV